MKSRSPWTPNSSRDKALSGDRNVGRGSASRSGFKSSFPRRSSQALGCPGLGLNVVLYRANRKQMREPDLVGYADLPARSFFWNAFGPNPYPTRSVIHEPQPEACGWLVCKFWNAWSDVVEDHVNQWQAWILHAASHIPRRLCLNIPSSRKVVIGARHEPFIGAAIRDREPAS